MQLHRVTFKEVAKLCALVASFLIGAAPVGATGVLTIHHSDGDVDTYKNVAIKVLHGSLYLTSGDGKGTLIVHRAACSYQQKLLVCFTTTGTLVQSGKTSPLDLKTGTVYLNDTDVSQPLVLSSTVVPPHSVLLSFSTNKGTYVNLSGRIDQVVK